MAKFCEITIFWGPELSESKKEGRRKM
ncbi:hypothetical protein CCACVL1_10278 [Corchorus capsularis]|uniref:Uncharacterized protein n=1 Tax=Corchorus capsularis TaxID=210143 RepID=A0A1R3IRX0_COCAP|nr:hypothetical protein CCACVL1_10278 [Corchorus capsularis]